ncbi:hypothetical protein OOZ63_28940 [Paucibacter sp. PLA-PC-4]|nr:hypothetical protein [Paucibacter sp. PLA-PC-4]
MDCTESRCSSKLIGMISRRYRANLGAHTLAFRLAVGSLALLLTGCEPSAEEAAEKCARLTREQEVQCFNRRCEGDVLPSYDNKLQALLKLNGFWQLGPREYFKSGNSAAYFNWPIGTESGPNSKIEIYFNGRGSWLIPLEPDKVGVSESLCVRHSMSTWSMNATQEENRSPYGQCGAAAILSRSA